MDTLSKVVSKIDNEIEHYFKGQPVSEDFYSISVSSGKDIGRTFPQTEISRLDYIASDFRSGQLPDNNTHIGQLFLYKGAKLTDCISTATLAGQGFILSKKGLKVFQSTDLGNHRVYPLDIIHKETKLVYYFLYIENDLLDSLNYKASSFCVETALNIPLGDIAIKSKEDLRRKSKELGDKKIKEFPRGMYISIKRAFIPQTNSLDIYNELAHYFISKRLNDLIKENSLTGFDIRQIRRLFLKK